MAQAEKQNNSVPYNNISAYKFYVCNKDHHNWSISCLIQDRFLTPE